MRVTLHFILIRFHRRVHLTTFKLYLCVELIGVRLLLYSKVFFFLIHCCVQSRVHTRTHRVRAQTRVCIIKSILEKNVSGSDIADERVGGGREVERENKNDIQMKIELDSCFRFLVEKAGLIE